MSSLPHVSEVHESPVDGLTWRMEVIGVSETTDGDDNDGGEKPKFHKRPYVNPPEGTPYSPASMGPKSNAVDDGAPADLSFVSSMQKKILADMIAKYEAKTGTKMTLRETATSIAVKLHDELG